MGPRPTNGDEKPVERTARVARVLVPAAPALVRALVLRKVDKRRDESRRGRHKCPRHPGIDNLSDGLWRKFFGTGGRFFNGAAGLPVGVSGNRKLAPYTQRGKDKARPE